MTSSSAYGALIMCCAMFGLFVRTIAHLVLNNLAVHFAGRQQPAAPLV